MTEEQTVAEALAALTAIVDKGFTHVRQDVALVANDLTLLKSRVAAVEGRLIIVEGTPSGHDLAQEARLGEEIVARQELEKKLDALLDIATRAENFWKKITANKWAKLILVALGLAAYRYLESRGIHLPALPGLS